MTICESISSHFADLIQAADLHNAAAGHGWIGTWPQWFWPARIPIDHILIKGPLIVTRFKRGPAIGSDHFPVLAELRITASTSTLRDRGATEASRQCSSSSTAHPSASSRSRTARFSTTCGGTSVKASTHSAKATIAREMGISRETLYQY